jgi:hypothetical protein
MLLMHSQVCMPFKAAQFWGCDVTSASRLKAMLFSYHEHPLAASLKDLVTF